MIYSELSRKEQTAIIRSFILILMSNAQNNNLSLAQERFLSSVLLRMHLMADRYVIQESMLMSDSEMIDIIKNFEKADKNQLGKSWLASVLQSRGMTGCVNIKDYRNDFKIINLLAKKCNVDVPERCNVSSVIFL